MRDTFGATAQDQPVSSAVEIKGLALGANNNVITYLVIGFKPTT